MEVLHANFVVFIEILNAVQEMDESFFFEVDPVLLQKELTVA